MPRRAVGKQAESVIDRQDDGLQAAIGGHPFNIVRTVHCHINAAIAGSANACRAIAAEALRRIGPLHANKHNMYQTGDSLALRRQLHK